MSRGRKARKVESCIAREEKRRADRRRYAGALKASHCGPLGDTTDLTELVRVMVGATIVNVGFCDANLEGGFAIDFQPRVGPKQRMVLGYTDLGEWVEYLDGRDDDEA